MDPLQESENTISASTRQPAEEFRRLMDQVRDGSQDAAWNLLTIYGPHVHRVVSRMLGSQMRSKFDSMDFVQSVWLSFFKNRAAIANFETASQLVAFLATAARNKVCTESRRRLYTQKHDIRRECALVDIQQPLGGDPSPSQFAMAREKWNQLLAGQPEHYQAILRLRYAGESIDNIASELNVNERTVRRVLDKLFEIADS